MPGVFVTLHFFTWLSLRVREIPMFSLPENGRNRAIRNGVVRWRRVAGVILNLARFRYTSVCKRDSEVSRTLERRSRVMGGGGGDGVDWWLWRSGGVDLLVNPLATESLKT